MADAALTTEHIKDEQIDQREAYYYRLVAGILCVSAITFGLLNLWGVVKM